jgi:WD40 repeat protein
VVAVAFSPDGKTAISSSWDGTTGVWDTETGRESVSIKWPGGAFVVAMSENGQMVATVAPDKSMSVWDRESGRLVRTTPKLPDLVRAVISPAMTGWHSSPLMGFSVSCICPQEERCWRCNAARREQVQVWHSARMNEGWR